MERHIDIQGAHNLRDLGGYHTNDGGIIKWRKIFRAGLLGKIKETEIDKMQALKLESICDFRTLAEQEATPDRWYNLEQLNRFSFPIGEGRVDKLGWIKSRSPGAGKDHYLNKANRSYVLKHTDRFKAFFRILLDDRNYPILYHCTAGKDRTGFASFLLLNALGVDHETIQADYLLTNKYLESFAEKASEKISKKLDVDQQHIKSIFLAKVDYLDGALDIIAQNYGTLDMYLKDALKIGAPEIKQLKKILVDY